MPLGHVVRTPDNILMRDERTGAESLMKEKNEPESMDVAMENETGLVKAMMQVAYGVVSDGI